MSEDLTAVVDRSLLAGAGVYSLSAQLFKNIESFPGQVLVTPNLLSAKQEGKIARKHAVRGARHVERTSGHIWGGLDRSADMVIGGKLIVHPTPDWDMLGISDWTTKKPFAQACQRAFNHWAYDGRNLCDAEGHYNFSGLMWMAFRNIKGPDGETGGIIHYDEDRRAEYATPWATFVTVLDPDRIATRPQDAGDPTIFEGRKLDAHGRMIGIWVRKGHPSESWVAGAEEQYEFIPRETYWGRAMAWHWFFKRRGGQQRGLTSLITQLRRTTMLDQFDDAQLGAAVIAAVLQTYIKTTASAETMAEQLAPAADGLSVIDRKLDYYGKAKVSMAGQRIPLLAPNDDIVMASVARAIADPTAFRTGFLREFGMALGLAEGQIGNSFANYNYSSARADLLEIFRGVHRERLHFTASTASLIYAAVIEEAIANGAVELPPGAPPFQENRAAYTACEWVGPGMGTIDPLKEANAQETRLKNKTTTRQREAASEGYDYLEDFDQIEQENAEAEERDFSLDIAAGTQMAVADDSSSATPAKKKPGQAAGDGDGDGIPNEDQAGA